MSLPNESLVTKSIFGHKGSLTPCDTFRPDSRQIPKGRQVPKGCQVPNGHQVSSLTQRDTIRSNSRHE